MPLRFAFVAISMLVLGCQTGGDPLAVGGAAPATCEAAQPGAGSAPVVDAGATATSPGLGLWFSNGLVQEMNAEGFGTGGTGRFDVADLLTGYIGYGMDWVTLRQSGRIAAGPGIDWGGPPTVLFVDGRLAQFVWDGMSKPVVSTNADATIRESPGGRVHCEQSNRSQTLECAFRGVVRVDFR